MQRLCLTVSRKLLNSLTNIVGTGHDEQVLEWKKHNDAALERDIVNVSKYIINIYTYICVYIGAMLHAIIVAYIYT